MATLRHCNFIRRVLVTFFGVNCLLIVMITWGGRYSAYVTVTDDSVEEISTRKLKGDLTLNIPVSMKMKRLSTKVNTAIPATAAATKTLTTSPNTATSTNYVFERLQARVNFTRKQCQLKWSEKLGPYLKSYIFYDKRGKIAQCSVSKAGSTYWGRIFSFLTRPEMMKSLNVHAPAQIDRVWLHHMSGVRGQIINGNATDIVFKNVHPLRFFFARDPYQRLWSTYLDKYYLPGYWRYNLIKGITNNIINNNNNKTCEVNNDSFQTFLEDAVKSDDVHVIPISTACNPCVFKPDIIGDMATFSSDTAHILRVTNYTHLLADYTDESFVEREIRTLIYYNFVLWRAVKDCLTLKELSRRLWRVFQYNGYIRKSSRFPEDMPEYSALTSTDMFLGEASSRPVMSKTESRQQRDEFLVEAYRDVPKWLFQRIRHRFAADFELFGYDIDPPT